MAKRMEERRVKLYGYELIVPDIPLLRILRGNTGKITLEVDGLYHAAYSDHRVDKYFPRNIRAFAAIAHTEWRVYESTYHVVDEGHCRPNCRGCWLEEQAQQQASNWLLVYMKATDEVKKDCRKQSLRKK